MSSFPKVVVRRVGPPGGLMRPQAVTVDGVEIPKVKDVSVDLPPDGLAVVTVRFSTPHFEFQDELPPSLKAVDE